MRKSFFSFTVVVLLLTSIGYFGSSADINVEEASIPQTEAIAETAEEVDFFCSPECTNMTFSVSQGPASCCSTTAGCTPCNCMADCSCVTFTVNGLYALGCQNNVIDIWFESPYLCSVGSWSGTSPSIDAYIDVISNNSKCSGTGSIPVTMRWRYYCGSEIREGSYLRNVGSSVIAC